VSQQTNINKVDSKEIVRVIFESICTALGNGDKVTIIGFGSFKPIERPTRKGRHPQTDESNQKQRSNFSQVKIFCQRNRPLFFQKDQPKTNYYTLSLIFLG